MSHGASRTTRRQVLRLAAAAAAAGSLPLPAADLEPYATLDLDWVDAARQRAVPVRLYWPDSSRADAPVPLVLFSHGIGGARGSYSHLGRHYASHGIASLHVQHVGSDRQLWFGSVLTLVGRFQHAAHETEALARVLDLRFALDTVLASDRGTRIDKRRIAVAGHSYGANTTLLTCGACVERQGRRVEVSDPRAVAAIVISAPPFYGEPDPKRILAGVTVPSLHITATEDVIRIPGYYSDVNDRIAVFDATGSRRKWLAVYEGGSHAMFTDRGLTGGPLLNPIIKGATQALTLAFLRRVFDLDGAALAEWPARHADLLARFSVVGA